MALAASPRLRTAALYVVTAVLALLLAWVTLDLWSLRWEVPLTYNGDALAVAAHMKTVLETGWYEYQPALGAPYGQVYHDYPAAENLHFMVAAVLGLFGASWGAVMNIHFVLGFPLAAVAMLWFARRAGASPLIAAALGLVYAIAPYHFSRGEGHLFLAWYWVVPLALGLVLAMLRGQPVWGARPGVRRGFGHLLGRTGATVGILVLLGTGATYYSAFTLLLGGLAAVAALWMRRDWRRFAGAVAAAATLGVVLLINMAPDILHRLSAGVNPGALQRTPVESEIYALKLSQLLLPTAHHRFGPFAHLRSEYDTHYPLPSEPVALGLIGAAGLIALVITVFYLVARAVPRAGDESFAFVAGRGTPATFDNPGGLASRLAPLAFLVSAALIFASVGGLSTLISFVSTSLRAWNRISIVIAALALAAVGILLDAAVRRIVTSGRTARAADAADVGGMGVAAAGAVRRRGVVAASVIAVLLVAFAVWDQAPAPDRERRASVVAEFDSDAAFGAELESTVSTGDLTFQLPYIDFPESPPVNGALDSDQLRPYLHTDGLRFSAAGIRGRDDVDSLADVAALAASDAEEFEAEARALGFSGVIVDTLAFAAGEGEGLASSLGDVAITAPNGRFLYIPLD